jgi:hypothetical protein
MACLRSEATQLSQPLTLDDKKIGLATHAQVAPMMVLLVLAKPGRKMSMP